MLADYLSQLRLALLPGMSLLLIRPLFGHIDQGPHGLVINSTLFRCIADWKVRGRIQTRVLWWLALWHLRKSWHFVCFMSLESLFSPSWARILSYLAEWLWHSNVLNSNWSVLHIPSLRKYLPIVHKGPQVYFWPVSRHTIPSISNTIYKSSINNHPQLSIRLVDLNYMTSDIILSSSSMKISIELEWSFYMFIFIWFE